MTTGRQVNPDDLSDTLRAVDETRDRNVPPRQVRFPLALPVLLPVAWRVDPSLLPRLRGGHLTLAGLALGAHFALQTAVLVYTTASRGALIEAGVPLATAIAAALMLNERLDRRLVGASRCPSPK